MTIHILSVSCTTATGLSHSVTIIKTNITSTYFNGMVDVRTGVLITFKTERKLNFFQSKIFNCFQHTFAHSKVKDPYIHRNVMIFRASTTYISIYTYFNLTINSSLYPVDQKYMNPEYISYVVFLKKKKKTYNSFSTKLSKQIKNHKSDRPSFIMTFCIKQALKRSRFYTRGIYLKSLIYRILLVEHLQLNFNSKCKFESPL